MTLNQIKAQLTRAGVPYEEGCGRRDGKPCFLWIWVPSRQSAVYFFSQRIGSGRVTAAVKGLFNRSRRDPAALLEEIVDRTE